MADAFASRVSARAAPAPENAKVRGVIPGQTVIVLENGDVVCGQLMPNSVRVDAERSPDGSLNYSVDWQIQMGKVK